MHRPTRLDFDAVSRRSLAPTAAPKSPPAARCAASFPAQGESLERDVLAHPCASPIGPAGLDPQLLASDPVAKAVWARLTSGRQQGVCEEVATAKRPAPRERRASGIAQR
jgi:Bacteriocin-protection, YdeI or OmpD-Associated